MSSDHDEAHFGPVAAARLADLRHVGTLTQVDANAQDGRLLETSHGADSGKDHIDLTAIMDDEGVIQAVKYRTLGSGWDLLCCDIMSELCLGKKAEAFETISGKDVGRWLLENGEAGEDIPADLATRSFPVLIKLAVLARGGVPEPVAAPTAGGEGGQTASQLAWDEVGLFEKVRRVEEILDDQVRPMLASDGGGIELVDLRDNDLHVNYSGACGSCSSSIGGTMVFIEDTLNNALGVELRLVVQGMDEPEPFMDL